MAKPEIQVEDDWGLLEQMLADAAGADAIFRPTNYWTHYAKRFVPELRHRGLRNFRQRRGSILSSMGASDLAPRGEVVIDLDIRGRGTLSAALTRVVDYVPFIKLAVSGPDPRFALPWLYEYVDAKFERAGIQMARCHTTTLGNPEETFSCNGGVWTRKHLEYCSTFVDVVSRLSLPSAPVVCELGAGMGRHVEIMARCWDQATILVVDIPPQLYVANQYLSAVFGNRVIGYREAVEMRPDATSSRGRIIIIPTWKLRHWLSLEPDLFWNVASFQEMEPDVVENYLKIVGEMEPRWIYISAVPRGQAWYKGRGGTREAVTESLYYEALADSYELDDSWDTDELLSTSGYRSYLFSKR